MNFYPFFRNFLISVLSLSYIYTSGQPAGSWEDNSSVRPPAPEERESEQSDPRGEGGRGT